MAPSHDTILNNLLFEFRRRIFEESYPRIIQCLNILSEKEIWYSPNENSNSVGNLVLHLMGNIVQWIESGLGKIPDSRERDSEFFPRNNICREELIQLMKQTKLSIETVLDSIVLEDLEKKHPVQCYTENGLSIIIHVIEHFSYHTGQITYIVKSLKNCDTGYYKNQDLNRKS